MFVAGALAVAVLIALHSESADLVRRAAAAPNNANPNGAANGGLTNFVNAANGLIDPAIVAAAAVTPLACIAGPAAPAFGSGRGLVIIVSAAVP